MYNTFARSFRHGSSRVMVLAQCLLAVVVLVMVVVGGGTVASGNDK